MTSPPVPAAPAAPSAILAPQVQGLGCPSCGGALAVALGRRVVSCPYCGKTLLAVGALGVERLAVMPRSDAARAAEVARGWLGKGWNKDPALRREARVGESFLCFLPFYRVRAEVVGHALGTEKRQKTTGSGKNRRTVTYEVDVERSVKESFDRTYPAVNVAEWGVRRVDLKGDEVVPFDADTCERLGMVFPATGSEPEVVAGALESFRQEADPARGLERVRFRWLETLRERVGIVHYPLWIVRYEFRGRSYQVLVDGEDGSLAYGKAPGNDLYRAVMMVASQGLALFAFTTAIHWGADSDDGCSLILGAGVVALAILAWGWKRFRYGGVVIEGSGVVEGETAVDRKLAKLKQRLGVKT